MTSTSDDLHKVTNSIPGGGELRPGQEQMANAVAEAIDDQKTLLVEAGTGTGKSLAYLTPAISANKRTVVATATIALQSQLAEHDISRVATGLDRHVSARILKGRSNYLCRQALGEITRSKHEEQLQLLGGRNPSAALEPIIEWAETTTTGDKEELQPSPTHDVWSAVSVGADDCPGAARCPEGEECFAERARNEAYEADVIITNHHYYGVHLASGGELLPEHDVVIFDEAHQLVDTLGATCGTELGGRRLANLARRWRSVSTDEEAAAAIERNGNGLDALLRPSVGARCDLSSELIAHLVAARERVETTVRKLHQLNPPPGGDAEAKIDRAIQAGNHLVDDIDAIIEADDEDVLWVGGSDINPVLKRTPLNVAELLDLHLWDSKAAILTSATLADDVGLRLGTREPVMRVESPFNYEKQGLLYCATHLPDPRADNYRDALHDELDTLITAAGGRTLALFTSYWAMNLAVEALASRLPGPILVQGDAPREKLIQQLRSQHNSALFATMSFWQGVDIAGDDLILVTIDRIPFPRPDEPITQALREKAGAAAFRLVDIPRAQTLLAQAAGRLIRRSDDEGVVAVLDPRLAKNKSYRWELINALPPMSRTGDRDIVVGRLQQLQRDASGSDS